MNRTKYPMNDVELESDESGDDDDDDESDSESDVYVFLTSSGNHDATDEDFDADDDAADDGSVDDDAFESFLENMLNIEFDADAGGFEFANDMFVCVCVCLLF